MSLFDRGEPVGKSVRARRRFPATRKGARSNCRLRADGFHSRKPRVTERKTKMRVLQTIKRAARFFGVDIRRLHNASDYTLLGLRGTKMATVIDVGANRGQFASEALRAFSAAHLHCVEPLPEPFKLLAQWASQQGGDRVFLYQTAVGDYCGVAELFEHVDHSPSSSILQRTEVSTAIFPQTCRQMKHVMPITTLDNWRASLSPPLARPLLLKIDVQGYETHVLRGARDLLTTVDYCILEVSMLQFYEGQASFAELVSLLAAANLVYSGNINQFHAKDGSVLFVDALFKRLSS